MRFATRGVLNTSDARGEHVLTLQQALEHFHQIAKEKPTSTLRLSSLATYCVETLSRLGLSGAETEVTVPGFGRPKQWDVAWQYDGKFRLAISLKSIMRNVAGTVPNRIDDLMGEVANLQLYSPEIVVGYLMVFDVSQDPSGEWVQQLESRLQALSGRSAPAWSVGMLEGAAVIRVDFSGPRPRLLSDADGPGIMLRKLVEEVRRRNPGIPSPPRTQP